MEIFEIITRKKATKEEIKEGKKKEKTEKKDKKFKKWQEKKYRNFGSQCQMDPKKVKKMYN